MKKKIIYSFISLVVIAYVGFCATVYFYPQYFFYNPTKEKADLTKVVEKGFKAQEINYKAKDGTELYGWAVKPRKGKKMIVFYHGNSYNIAKFIYKLKPLTDQGYGVFIGEYRGFGGIDGEITQKGLETDAMAVIDKLHSWGYRNKQIVLYGMSLGSHTSSYVAANSKGGKFAGLILEVPFDSLLNVVKQRIWSLFPFDMIVKDKYDNIDHVKSLNIPVLIMASNHDKVVPIQRALKLFDAVNEPKEMIVYDNVEHSKLFDADNWKDILEWLKNK